MKNNLKLAGLVALALGAVTAQAAAVDVSAVATAITETIVPIGIIGAGVLLIKVALKTFAWVRAALG